MPGQFTVDPDLRVIIESSFEDQCRSTSLISADQIRYRDSDAVPVEADASGCSSLVEARRAYGLPFRIIEVQPARVGRVVVRRVQGARRLAVRAGSPEIGFDDSRVAIPPLALDESCPFARSKINCRCWSARRRINDTRSPRRRTL